VDQADAEALERVGELLGAVDGAAVDVDPPRWPKGQQRAQQGVAQRCQRLVEVPAIGDRIASSVIDEGAELGGDRAAIWGEHQRATVIFANPQVAEVREAHVDGRLGGGDAQLPAAGPEQGLLVVAPQRRLSEPPCRQERRRSPPDPRES
jgi:hypothetical protein